MKAAYYETTGAPEVIQYGDLPTPEPRAGQVRVQVRAAALNPIDTYIRSGAVAAQLPKPFIPGCDFAGVVEKVGDGVSHFKVGDRVWGSNQGLQGRQGTFAEYCCPDAAFVYPIPEGVSDEDAAAASLVALTAHIGLFHCAKLQPGEFVFVNGGTGGLGSMVVQMARAVGARPVTTVGSEEKGTLAKSLGAEFVINYKAEDVGARVKEFTGGKGLQVWFETLREPDLVKTVDSMAPRGRIVLVAGRTAQPLFPVGPFYVKGLSLFGFAIFNMTTDEQRICSETINRWLRDGSLKAQIGRRMKLSEAAQAHRLQEDNTLQKAGTLSGKIVLTP
jgi:NADPH2:quinone reductase